MEESGFSLGPDEEGRRSPNSGLKEQAGTRYLAKKSHKSVLTSIGTLSYICFRETVVKRTFHEQ